MEYRNLGRTGIKVSPLCLGCMMFGGRTEPEESYRIIDRAIDAGINFLDTANVYSRGRSEEVTGEALKRNGKRDGIVLATKVRGAMDDDDPNMVGITRRHIIQQCDASLKRLQTDWIDLYQMHRPQPDVPIEETLRALDDLIRAGKVRYIGTSTFAGWQLAEAWYVAKELGLNRFVCEQPPYNILDRRIERGLLPFCKSYGVGVIPWSPLAGGLLTGKYERGKVDESDGRYADAGDWQKKRLTEEAFDAVDKVVLQAKAKGCTPAQFSLAWVLAQDGISSAIIGPRTMEQLEDNLGALEVEWMQADSDFVDATVPYGRMVSPFYESSFGPSKYPPL